MALGFEVSFQGGVKGLSLRDGSLGLRRIGIIGFTENLRGSPCLCRTF